MWSHDNAIEGQIGAMAARACVELFGAYGVALAPGTSRWAASDERLLSGSIGFVGQRIRGTCLLAAAESPLMASLPEHGTLRDWVGELTNQFVGRLKTKLLSRGVEVYVTTPIVLSGIRIQPLPRANVEPAVFACSAGDVLTWVEVETEERFVLGSEHPDRSGFEGDIIVL
jgi:hypothetical protein